MRKSVQFAAVLAVLFVGAVVEGAEMFFPGGRTIPNAPAWVALTGEKHPPIAVAGNAVFTITPVPGGMVYSTPEDEVLMGIQRYVVNGKPSASPVDFPLWYNGATAPAAAVPTTGGIFTWGVTQADFVKAHKALLKDAKLLKSLEEQLAKADAKDKETLKNILKELKKLNADKDEAKKNEAPKADVPPAPAPAPKAAE